MALNKKGILIAIEGIDGSGKSTLANNLFTLLKNKNHDVILTKEPGDTPLGKEIRHLVQTQKISIDPLAEYLLFAADRAQHFAQVIIPALEQKKIIISDRLSDSSLAYQGYGRGLDCQKIIDINHWAMHNIQPDITIFVKVPVKIALERVSQRREISAFEKKAFLARVAHGFETLYKNRTDVIVLDGQQNPDMLVCAAYNTFKKMVNNPLL
jgi:dTMP kinase